MASDWKDLLASIMPADGDNENDVKVDADNIERNAAPKSVTLFYEVKGRSGKPATILADFSGVDSQEINALASELKRSLGTGGSVRGGEILIQGDRRVDLRKLLAARNFKVKG